MENRWIKKETLLVLAVLIILFFLILHNFAQNSFDWMKVKDYIMSFGTWTPIILLLIIIITSSIGFIFTIPVAIAAILMGVYGAFFISILGLTIGSAISFFLARYLGRDYFEKKYIHKIKKLELYDVHLKDSGFLIIFYLRLISLIPYELINILAGLSRIEFKSFLLGTFFGIMPGTLITIYLVNSTKNILSMQFSLAMLIFIGFTLLPLLSKKIRHIIFNF